MGSNLPIKHEYFMIRKAGAKMIERPTVSQAELQNNALPRTNYCCSGIEAAALCL